MSNRDWERELADIDRRLAAEPEPASASAPARDAPPRDAPPRDAPPRGSAAPVAVPTTPDAARRTVEPAPARSIGTPAASGRRSWRAQVALLVRLVLGVAVVAALIYWPYSARCGVELGYYLGLVAALGLVGIGTSTSAWRHRSGIVHLLGLAMLAGAVALSAREILPKIGYAIPSAAHPATWTCTT